MNEMNTWPCMGRFADPSPWMD